MQACWIAFFNGFLGRQERTIWCHTKNLGLPLGFLYHKSYFPCNNDLCRAHYYVSQDSTAVYTFKSVEAGTFVSIIKRNSLKTHERRKTIIFARFITAISGHHLLLGIRMCLMRVANTYEQCITTPFYAEFVSFFFLPTILFNLKFCTNMDHCIIYP